uniref:Peroxisome proliferator-activated receptor gamma, coactivator 1 beta n=1 Tax=Neogobius melanostomus TaxID=47308 RepID=A0A8C6V242_9GOBI
MADCAPLLDEELSSFVFNYLTENSCSQVIWEEEVCSDRLDTDFPDIDLSQLDPSDFNCLSELQWCSDQEPNASPASIRYSTADELFQIEEENAALLAALTDSLDGMVDAEVGGLSVFPALEEEEEPDSDHDSLPLSQNFSQSLGLDSEDPSLLKKLLLTPPNVPLSLTLVPSAPLQTDLPLERKPRAVRPSSRLCTELHRHLTTSGHRGNEDTATAESEDDEDEEEEEEEDSESEEDEDSSGSEAEAHAAPQPEPAKPQFSSDKELQSVVDLITYMHTYCLPSRKQHGGWDRRDRDAQKPRSRPPSGAAQSNSHTRVVLVATPGTSLSGAPANGTASAHPRRIPFARRREVKANSLLRELLQQTSSYDVSKPYRLHSPPYTHLYHGLLAGPIAEDSGSFSVRRSRRLASFPSRFAKRHRPTRPPAAEKREDKEEGKFVMKLTRAPETAVEAGQLTPTDSNITLTDFCLTGLTPPTTPPHKPVEDELFKPTDGNKSTATGSDSGGGGGDSLNPASNSSTSSNTSATIGAKPSSWLRGAPNRKQPEQTELYAQLRRMGQAGDETHGSFGDHDYCALSLGESRKRSAAILGPCCRTKPQEEEEEEDIAADAEPGSEPLNRDQSADASTPPASEEETERSPPSRSPSPALHLCPDSPDNCQNMLRKRFQVFGNAEDCKVIIYEAGPGPVKSKYDALDFDTLLKEAQKSLHR